MGIRHDVPLLQNLYGETPMNLLSKLKAAVIGAIALVGSAANAALPTEATTAFTTLLADIGEMVTLAWTVLPVVTLAFIGIGLFKKFSKRAAS